MERESLNSGLESTVDETKLLLEQHYKLFLDTLIQIEGIGRVVYSTKDRISAALDKLRENSDDDIARQILGECQVLIDPLRESLSQHISECNRQMLEIHAAASPIKIAKKNCGASSKT